MAIFMDAIRVGLLGCGGVGSAVARMLHDHADGIERRAGVRIVRFMGIVNGTTNYVLTRMSEDRLTAGEALEEAQRLGYAERDPTADLNGDDAAAKAAILATIAFDLLVTAADVYRE